MNLQRVAHAPAPLVRYNIQYDVISSVYTHPYNIMCIIGKRITIVFPRKITSCCTRQQRVGDARDALARRVAGFIIMTTVIVPGRIIKSAETLWWSVRAN